ADGQFTAFNFPADGEPMRVYAINSEPDGALWLGYNQKNKKPLDKKRKAFFLVKIKMREKYSTRKKFLAII
ncbi:MAG: hypothetical protein II008_01385, partial [Oscillospiraceae bacterium]|nr:hypothetical protein [Oscillospiraceae bacterium]